MNYIIFITIGLFIISYLIGSIPHGLVLGLKFKNIDIREHGSNNIGATNAIRVLGKKLGLTAFFLDVLKGGFVIIIVKYIIQPLDIFHLPHQYLLIFLGVVAVLGHVFPIYLKFKGGKAVATSLGILFALTPLPALITLIVFIILIKTMGYVSVASVLAAFTALTITILFNIFGTQYGALLGQPGNHVVFTYALLVVLIVVKHKKNYIRLLNGTEPNVKRNKKEKLEQASNEVNNA